MNPVNHQPSQKYRYTGCELYRKCLHWENDRLLSRAIHHLTIINRIRKKYSHDNIEHTIAQINQNTRQAEYVPALRRVELCKCHDKYHRKACYLNNKSWYKKLAFTESLAKQRYNHHDKHLCRKSNCSKYRICALVSHIKPEEIKHQVTTDIEWCIHENDWYHNSHSLIVLK